VEGVFLGLRFDREQCPQLRRPLSS
jgi:hypothetical protein